MNKINILEIIDKIHNNIYGWNDLIKIMSLNNIEGYYLNFQTNEEFSKDFNCSYCTINFYKYLYDLIKSYKYQEFIDDKYLFNKLLNKSINKFQIYNIELFKSNFTFNIKLPELIDTINNNINNIDKTSLLYQNNKLFFDDFENGNYVEYNNKCCNFMIYNNNSKLDIYNPSYRFSKLYDGEDIPNINLEILQTSELLYIRKNLFDKGILKYNSILLSDLEEALGINKNNLLSLLDVYIYNSTFDLDRLLYTLLQSNMGVKIDNEYGLDIYIRHLPSYIENDDLKMSDDKYYLFINNNYIYLPFVDKYNINKDINDNRLMMVNSTIQEKIKKYLKFHSLITDLNIQNQELIVLSPDDTFNNINDESHLDEYSSLINYDNEYLNHIECIYNTFEPNVINISKDELKEGEIIYPSFYFSFRKDNINLSSDINKKSSTYIFRNKYISNYKFKGEPIGYKSDIIVCYQGGEKNEK